MLAMGALAAATPAAHAETRTLKLYFIHTKERAEITYKRNGRYIQSGLKEVNRFLRDWRRNEPTNMSPQLLDLLWEVYRASGGRDYIHVVSAYRSPQTNSMLRSRSNGVAKKSQHMLGKAIDFYIPGVNLAKLRATALKFQAGGVGYYPRSGSPFVHLDVGSVRHWPRMSRKELVALFPDGKTLHVPTDGKPLPGYQQALAAYESRKRSGSTVQVARDTGNGRKGGGLLAALFGGGADEEEDNADVSVASARQPSRQAPAPAAAVPAAQPAAEPPAPVETPATILAALPERSLPLPRSAPRPDAAVGQPLPFEVKPVEDAPVVEQTPPADAGTALLVAANVPLPTHRPDYTPPQATPDSATRDALIQMASATTDAPDAIASVLADAEKDLQQPITTAAYLPVPSQRPQRAAAANDFTLASLPQPAPAPQPASAPQPPAAPLPSADEAVANAPAVTSPPAQRGQPVSASPRLALLTSGDASTAARTAKRVHTTSKSAKPGPKDVSPEAQPVVVAADASRASRALSRQSMLTEAAHVTHPPAFDSEFVRSPNAVYTTGFQQNIAVADATRFTGKAVNFISMAKFRTN
ncbi:DUF882 domain-containing protein [Nitratireductor sp. ZSWI3]|uniref:DUF882 domain-containing protein n=1 Tax=Nitratireductor sp. ZSWI3 TaxID=2966359 RepID=UPI00215057E8|nr:DUF882 domain-containing protein [Nitratireductor sp. ZSWI3]